MRSRGISGKPIWLVETNAPPSDDPYWRVEEWTLSVTLNEQAAFMPQALVSALAAGAGAHCRLQIARHGGRQSRQPRAVWPGEAGWQPPPRL
ncbi:MAG: hypothetical protein M5U34_08340 [Chloroflexi bacterium]|nr:hypothetical protein [Chloroflexota bacterium]